MHIRSVQVRRGQGETNHGCRRCSGGDQFWGDHQFISVFSTELTYRINGQLRAPCSVHCDNSHIGVTTIGAGEAVAPPLL